MSNSITWVGMDVHAENITWRQRRRVPSKLPHKVSRDRNLECARPRLSSELALLGIIAGPGLSAKMQNEWGGMARKQRSMRATVLFPTVAMREWLILVQNLRKSTEISLYLRKVLF